MSSALSIRAQATTADHEAIKARVDGADFSGFGDFLRAVAFDRHNRIKPYMAAVKGYLGMGEGSDADGIPVPITVAADIWRNVMNLSNLPVSYANERETPGPTYKWRKVRNSSQVAGSRFGGLTIQFLAEGARASVTKPAFEYSDFRITKRVAYIAVTDELLEDVPGIEQDIGDLVAEELGRTLSDEMINGLGGAKFVGILKSNALVTIAKEDSQTANTVVAANISKMVARIPADNRAKAVWFYHPQLSEQFDLLASVTSHLVQYASPGEAMAGAPPMTIAGRPAWPCEACAVPGSPGDLIFADFGCYALIRGRSQFATSGHIYFDTKQSALRWTFRLDGHPLWSGTRTPAYGSQAESPYVVIAERGS